MSINVSLKRVVVVCVLLIIGGSAWWADSTKDERAAADQYDLLVRVANRQQVEIAIIRRAMELRELKQTFIPTEPVIVKPEVDLKNK